MHFHSWIVGAVLFAVSAVEAQITVEIAFDQDQFLRDEMVPLKLRITNRSGQTLTLAEEPDWVNLTVESREGFVVRKLANVEAPGQFVLESASVATRVIDLTPFYDLSQGGRYTVTATIRVPQWSDTFTSRARGFEVVRGSRIWEMEFGVPITNGPPEVRKYILQQAPYMKNLVLYVRIADTSDQRVVRVFPVGPLVSFSRPEAQVDQASRLHLLFQTGARSFSYNLISPDGIILKRQSHDYTSTRPVLRGNKEGEVQVVGGVRRPTQRDIPPPSAEAQEAPALTP